MSQDFCPYTGKVKFRNAQAAKIVNEKQPKGRLFKPDSRQVELSIYKCPDCGTYHIGSEKISIKRREIKKSIDILLELGGFINRLSKRNRVLRKDRN